MQEKILLIGGYGVVGAQVAAILRRHHPGLRLVVAGRRYEAAARLASRIGDAEAVAVNVQGVDPLAKLPDGLGAVVMLVNDHDDAVLRGAVRRGIPYLDITRTNDRLASAYVAAAVRPPSAPVVFASNWMAGVPAVLAMHMGAGLAETVSVSVSILFYGKDKGGPDSEGVGATLAEPFAARVAGSWRKRSSMADTATVEFPSGLKRRVHGIATADIMTLAQATGARDVDVRLGLDDPVAGRITRFMVRSGLWTFLQSERLAWLRRRWTHDPTAGGAPHEIVIEVSGITPAGEAVTRRSTILDPAGQSHLTAVGTVAQIERLLGSRSEQLGPGVAVPETSPDAERLLSLLRSEAVQVNLAG